MPTYQKENLKQIVFPLGGIGAGSVGSDWSTPCVVLDFTPSTITMARELMDEYAEPGPFHQKMTHSLLDQLAIRLCARWAPRMLRLCRWWVLTCGWT